MENHPYRDAALSIGERVDDLLTRMSLEEKAGQLSQYFYFGIPDEMLAGLDIESMPPEQARFLQQPKMVEAAITSGGVGSVLYVTDPQAANRLQKMAVETGHGIPLIFGMDVVHGLRTIFPVPIAQAASWDLASIEAAQTVAAREARSVGIHWTFTPMVDISQDARWGRMVEGAGEDPYLGSAIAAAQVRGFQGNLGPESVLAGPKHFAGYGASRGGRDYEEVEISDSEFYNVYLPPFKAAIDAGAGNIMTAYMELNGVPASGNHWLLTNVLRGELGFKGFVVSDAAAVKNLEVQHFAASGAVAAVRAITAGLDMEMCMFNPAFQNLPEAAAQGLLEESVIDAAVRRVLTAKFRLGLFENPYTDESASADILAASSSRHRARDAAERSAVLLKNDTILPLDEAELTSIAVIGQLADSKRDTLGPWVFAHDTDDTVTILAGLRARLGESVRVEHAPGASIAPRLFPSPFDRMDPTVNELPADYDDDSAIEQAVALASKAGLAIVVVGERQNQIGEKAARSTLDLPGRQLEQLQRIAATGTPIVLVVMSGRPLDLRWADANVAAILEVWYPGSRGGDAVASLLLGDLSPSGHLPFTWPRHVGHVPISYSHMTSFEPWNAAERYWDEESTPLYPFGYGLSYATFRYDNLQLGSDQIAVGNSVTVSVDVTNESDRDASDVVQLYTHQRFGTSARPVRELKGFQRVGVKAGETCTVRFVLGPEELTYWSAVTRGWIQDETTLDIWVGSASTAKLTTELTVRAAD